ncbi:tetratricopeptide repeat protein [[Clostridium] polysaccharolyticum]|nr:hypothetical protein [[Clostridium] polysaccharolyticum]
MEGVAVKQLKEHLEELEKKYQDGRFYSFNHISELYLYQFYEKDGEFQLSDEPMNRWYLELGISYEEKEETDEAYKAYLNAIRWNPVDLDARFAKLELDKKKGCYDVVLKETLTLYPYLCTRATMARFYRNIGFYYVETYQPDIAFVLYEYSNMFFQTENADNEIAYMEEALGKKHPDYDVHQLQSRISNLKIPVSAPSNTLGLIYEVGKSEEKKGHCKEAAECYLMVYDLTQDEEVKSRMNRVMH